MRRSLASALLASTASFAGAQPPLYAMYGITAGKVRSVNVGILPSGNKAECLRQIEVFEAAARRSRTSAGPELIPSSCVASLPNDLAPMVLGLTLADAYVVEQSGDWAPIYTAWYGLPTADPEGMCERLVKGMRTSLKPSHAVVACLAPKPPRPRH